MAVGDSEIIAFGFSGIVTEVLLFWIVNGKVTAGADGLEDVEVVEHALSNRAPTTTSNDDFFMSLLEVVEENSDGLKGDFQGRRTLPRELLLSTAPAGDLA